MPTDKELTAGDQDEEMAEDKPILPGSEMDVDVSEAEEDSIEVDDDQEDQAEEGETPPTSSPPRRRSARIRKPTRRFVESDDEDAQNDDDDLSDFIVPDGVDPEDDEAEYGTRNTGRRLSRLHRRRSSPDDDKFEEREEKEVICGHTNPEYKGKIKVLSRFLPSTKMMASPSLLSSLCLSYLYFP